MATRISAVPTREDVVHPNRVSTRDSIERANHSIQNMAHNYAELFRLYLQEGTAAYGQLAVMGVAGGILLLLGWIFFVAVTVSLATPAIPYWASMGFWMLVHLGLGAYLVFRVKKEIAS